MRKLEIVIYRLAIGIPRKAAYIYKRVSEIYIMYDFLIMPGVNYLLEFDALFVAYTIFSLR